MDISLDTTIGEIIDSLEKSNDATAVASFQPDDQDQPIGAVFVVLGNRTPFYLKALSEASRALSLAAKNDAMREANGHGRQ